MSYRAQIPPSYCGTKLLMCSMLMTGVAAFFLVYDGVAHRETRSLSDTMKSQPRSAGPSPLTEYIRFDELPAPDMNSPAVKFASADALQGQDALTPKRLQPPKYEITTAEAKQKERVRSVKRHGAKTTRIAKTKVRSPGRAYGQRYSPRITARAGSRLVYGSLRTRSLSGRLSSLSPARVY